AGIVVASLLVAGLGVLVWTWRGSPGAASAQVVVHANSIGVINVADMKLERDVPLGTAPGELAAGPDGLWVGESANDAIARINPRTSSVDAPVGLGISPDQMLDAFGSLWLYDSVDNRVAIVDPTNREPPDVRRFLPPCGHPIGITGQPIPNQRACGPRGLTSDPTA